MVSESTRFYLADNPTTQTLGQWLGQRVQGGQVILLRGELGMGKTSFVQGLAQGLGIEDVVVSPTFILLCEYPEGRIPLYHFDLYRLSGDEIQDLGLDMYWDGWDVEPGVVAIEWADRLQDKPLDYVDLHFTPADPQGRWVTWSAIGTQSQHLLPPDWLPQTTPLSP